ncbi:FecR domain-containing protein [Desulfobacterota bacterium M19]
MCKMTVCAALAIICMTAVLAHAADTIDITVSRGDCLICLCEKYLDDPANDWSKIARLNHLSNPARIYPGDVLVFPVDLLKGVPLAGVVTFIKGTAEFLPAGGSSWMSLKLNAVLMPGEVIKTLKDSAVQISYHDGDILFLRDNTRLRIDSARARTSHNRVYEMFLEAGRAINTIRRSTGKKVRYRVRTPTAVAAARGTEFRTRVEGDDVTRVEVLKGAVNVTADGRALEVAAGHGAVVRPKEAAPQLAALLPPPRPLGVKSLYRQMPLEFSFSALAGAASFRVMLARDAALKDVVKEKTISPSAVLRIVGVKDGVYFLGCRTVDRFGLEGSFNKPVRVKVRVNPLPPFVKYPKSQAALKERKIKLQWLKVGDAVVYHLQLAADKAFSSPVIDAKDITGTAYQTTKLAYGTYYFRLSSIADDNYEGVWSDTGCFTLIPPPPAPPVEPPELGKGGDVHIRWRNIGSGITYQVQIARQPDFTTLWLDKTVKKAELSFARPQKAATYYVRTRAVDPDGYTGNWSAPQSFNIRHSWEGWAFGTFFVTLIAITL